MKLSGLKRDPIDKFYTSNDVVNLCMDAVIKHLSIYTNDMIIEPSAGNGAFIKRIKEITNNYIFLDISPESDEIIQQDYLLYNHKNILPTHVIGNPPFGRQSSTALKFIKKSCEYAQSFSFILPRSFKKQSLHNKIPPLFHLVFEMDIPKNGFILDGRYDVPTVFQIWKKSDIERQKVSILEPNGYLFTTADNADISFRRVGVNAGTISTDVDKSPSSHYFIKFINIIPNLDMLKELVYESANDTVGAKSISKQELIKKFNQFIENNQL